jgi:hypothetical protein
MYSAAMSPGRYGFISAGIAPSQASAWKFSRQSAALDT